MHNIFAIILYLYSIILLFYFYFQETLFNDRCFNVLATVIAIDFHGCGYGAFKAILVSNKGACRESIFK